MNERFYDSNHQDGLFRLAHIINPFKKSLHFQIQLSNSINRITRRHISSSSLLSSPSITTTTNSLKASTEQTCLICYSIKSPNEMAGLEC